MHAIPNLRLLHGKGHVYGGQRALLQRRGSLLVQIGTSVVVKSSMCDGWSSAGFIVNLDVLYAFYRSAREFIPRFG